MKIIETNKSSKSNIYPKCYICGNVPRCGICGGFRLLGEFICKECEQRIIVSEAGTEEYLDIIRVISKILYSRQDEKIKKLC
ncbi:MAG: sigma factor G inhibitor Gin [Eubacteriales bacterium]